MIAECGMLRNFFFNPQSAFDNGGIKEWQEIEVNNVVSAGARG
jgi:hypothetical protein